MRFRFRAFSAHLIASAVALTLVLGTLYFGWYRWPGWYLSSAPHIIALVMLVDLLLGPALTFMVASPGKAHRVLARDVAVIVVLQVAALGYGTATLWAGRPLYYTFSVDRLQVVQAADIDHEEAALARQQNPALAPRWYSLPRWVWAPLPEDPDVAAKIVEAAVAGGPDVIEMPRYYRPWTEGLKALQAQLLPLDDVKALSPAQKARLRARLAGLGAAAGARNVLLMWGAGRRVLAVFEPQTMRRVALLEAD